MEDPKETLTTSISTPELERRWNSVREVMRDKKIDYLLMRNDGEFLGGYVRWFTDIPARHTYPYTVIFPVDDEMISGNNNAMPTATIPSPIVQPRARRNKRPSPLSSHPN